MSAVPSEMWPLTVLICLLVHPELSCRWTVDVLADWLEILLEPVSRPERVQMPFIMFL